MRRGARPATRCTPTPRCSASSPRPWRRPSRSSSTPHCASAPAGGRPLPLPAPDGSGALVVALDLHRHEAVAEHSDGRAHRIPLAPDRPVAEVTREVFAAVGDLVGPVQIDPTPQETPGRRHWTRTSSTPPTTHPRWPTTSPRPPKPPSSSPRSAPRTAGAPRRSTPGGARSTSPSACSPVDPPTRRRTTSSCATRPTPSRSKSAGGPATPATHGPPSSRSPSPSPDGFDQATLSPAAARWDTELGEYILDWDDVRRSPDPHRAAIDFGLSAIRHACLVCGWDPALAASAEGAVPPIA